jgi:hypothetical protein
MDFRRSGAVEGIAGEATLEVMAAKMANSIDENRELQKTAEGSATDARRDQNMIRSRKYRI